MVDTVPSNQSEREVNSDLPPSFIRPEVLPRSIRTDPRLRSEVTFYDALKAQLPPLGWCVFYSVPWIAPTKGGPPQDGEVDFVIAHPHRGVLVIELKGGEIRYDPVQTVWISRDDDGQDHVIKPFSQVTRNKYKLRQMLREREALRDAPYQAEPMHAVAFPDVPRPTAAATLDSPPEIIFGAEDLPHVYARIEEIFAFSKPSGKARDVRDHTLLVNELTTMIGNSITIRQPLSLAARDDDRDIVRLTQDQFRILNVLKQQRQAALYGCAGSGKTFLAVEKATDLAAHQEFRTLLTCYSEPLADHLQQATRAISRLDAMTVFDLTLGLANTAKLDTANGPTPDLLRAAIDVLPDARYQAVIVDEGQDLDDDWWSALHECILPNGVFYVFYDDNQQVYGHRTNLPVDILRFPLTENIRNTRAIYQMLIPHYTGEDIVRPVGPVGRSSERISYSTTEELGEKLGNVLQRLIKVEGFSSSDIVVLTPRESDHTALFSLHLPSQYRLAPHRPSPGSSDIWCTSVRSFKGLESQVVVLVELDDQISRDPAEQARLLYVGLSRARTHLILMGAEASLERLQPTGS